MKVRIESPGGDVRLARVVDVTSGEPLFGVVAVEWVADLKDPLHATRATIHMIDIPIIATLNARIEHVGSVHFNPDDPCSIERAIRELQAHKERRQSL